MKKRGRPTKVNRALTKRICAYLQQGVDQKTACNLAGVPYSTYNEWKRRGDEGIAPFRQFLSITSRVRDKHKLRLVKVVHAASMGALPRHSDWKAASWLLERGWPREYAPVYREQVPQPQPERKVTTALFLKMPDGTQRETTFAEAEKIFTSSFPRRDTYEPPTEAKLPPDSEPEGEMFGSLDEPQPNE